VSNDQQHIFVTRHGARIDNGPDRYPNWLHQQKRHQRRTDAHLSPIGNEEARELALAIQQRCQEQSITLQYIVSSPFIRCLETAHAVALFMKKTVLIQVEPGISEVGSSSSSMGSEEELITRDNYKFSSFIHTTYVPIVKRTELRGSAEGATVRQRAVQNE